MTDPVVALAALPADWAVQGGAVGMLGIVFLMVVTGRLVPRRTLEDVMRERDLWRDAALRSDGHVGTLLPAAEITTQVTQALSDAAAVDRAFRPTDTDVPR